MYCQWTPRRAMPSPSDTISELQAAYKGDIVPGQGSLGGGRGDLVLDLSLDGVVLAVAATRGGSARGRPVDQRRTHSQIR